MSAESQKLTSEDNSRLAQDSDKLRVSAKVGAGVAPRYEGASHYGDVPSALRCHMFSGAKGSALVDDRGDENQFFAGLLIGYQFRARVGASRFGVANRVR